MNHFKNELTLVENLFPDKGSQMDEVAALLENRNFASYNFQSAGPERSTITDQKYMEMVTRANSTVSGAMCFRLCSLRRFEQDYRGDDFKVYRALRSINPSPYLFYFDFGSFRIFGSSTRDPPDGAQGKSLH